MSLPRALFCAAFLMLAPAGVTAQTVATSFSDLPAILRSGESVDVTDAKGQSLRGRIGALTPSLLELMARRRAPDGTEALVSIARLAEADVRMIRVARRDSLLNGTLIGLAVGLGIAALPAAGIFCNPNYEDGPPLSSCLSFLGVLGGIGAGSGLAIDAARFERRMVFYRASVIF